MRKLSIADLMAIKADGGSIEKENQPVIIEDFSELITLMRTITEAQKQIALANEKNIYESVNKLTDALSKNNVDIKELAVLIASSVKPQTRPDYHFDVQRDTNGQLSGITATTTRILQ